MLFNKLHGDTDLYIINILKYQNVPSARDDLALAWVNS